MYKRRQVSAIVLLMIMLVLPATGQTRNTDSIQEGGLRPTMRAIFQALTTVIPLSLSGETFEDVANRQSLHDALLALSKHAMQLTKHGQNAPAGFNFLRRSLRRDAQKVFELFESESTVQDKK